MTPQPRQLLLVVLLALCPHLVPARLGTFWHVTDFHYDLNYTVDGSTDMYCWGASSDGSKKPGMFGDFACDAPLALVKSAVDAMYRIKPDPDFVLWTGDDTAHVPNEYFSKDKRLGIIQILTDNLYNSFNETLVVPVMGNHDFHPKSQAPIGPSYMQSEVAEMWGDWLDQLNGDTAFNSFNASGRYWADIPGSNVTVVALNTLLYYTTNSLTDSLPDSHPEGLDPDDQFQWLDELLTELAKRNRRVYLVGHIPPGSFERYQQEQAGHHWYQERYNEQFIKMVETHADTIAAQFFAHHHTDSFRLFFKDDSPISYQLIAPGVTPWVTTLSPEAGGNNPGIRLVTYETTTGQVMDVSTYYLNLTQANIKGKAEWVLEYNFTSAYELHTGLTPEALYTVAKDIKNGGPFFKSYYWANTVSLEDPDVCHSSCRLVHWCAITEVDYDRYNSCNGAGIKSPGGVLVALGVAVLVALVPRSI